MKGLFLKKKSEYRQQGTGAPVFVYWVVGDPASLARYKAVQENIKTTTGTRYITDDAPMYNDQPNPHKGAPVYQSFNGPLAEGTELLITDNGQGQNNVIANQVEDAPTNTALEREYVRKRDLLEAAEAKAAADAKQAEVTAARNAARLRRNPFAMGAGNTTGTPAAEQVADPNKVAGATAGAGQQLGAANLQQKTT